MHHGQVGGAEKICEKRVGRLHGVKPGNRGVERRELRCSRFSAAIYKASCNATISPAALPPVVSHYTVQGAGSPAKLAAGALVDEGFGREILLCGDTGCGKEAVDRYAVLVRGSEEWLAGEQRCWGSCVIFWSQRLIMGFKGYGYSVGRAWGNHGTGLRMRKRAALVPVPLLREFRLIHAIHEKRPVNFTGLSHSMLRRLGTPTHYVARPKT